MNPALAGTSLAAANTLADMCDAVAAASGRTYSGERGMEGAADVGAVSGAGLADGAASAGGSAAGAASADEAGSVAEDAFGTAPAAQKGAVR